MRDAEPDIEYRGMVAATWDLFRGDTSVWADRPFYLEAIRRFGEPALDVGCGTGRLLLDFVALGLDVDGVDISNEMLALCREKAERAGLSIRVYEQSMESLNLQRRYHTILVPSSSFQLVLDPAAATVVMGRFRDHLEPGGALVMPFMTLWQPGMPLTEEWSREAISPEDGALVRRHSVTRFDPRSGLEHTEDRFEAVIDGEVIASEHHVRSPATRSYTQDEALALYRHAGFEHIELLAEFEWAPAEFAARIFCVTGRRPEK